MTLEELSMRLTALEDSAKAERDAKRQQEFTDKYGNMFSNNRDILEIYISESCTIKSVITFDIYGIR